MRCGASGAEGGAAMTHRVPAPLVSSEFWMVAHDDRTGRSRLSPRLTGLGLACALLGELAFDDAVAVQDGVLVATSWIPPEDALTHTVLDHLHGEAGLSVGTWLQYLSRTAVDDVAARLVRLQVVRPVLERKLLARRTVYLPVDRNRAVLPTARLTMALLNQKPLPPRDVFLLGLAQATGLHRRLLEYAPPQAENYLTFLLASASGLHQELLAHLDAVIGAGVIAGR
jgi:hypothetical protein